MKTYRVKSIFGPTIQGEGSRVRKVMLTAKPLFKILTSPGRIDSTIKKQVESY